MFHGCCVSACFCIRYDTIVVFDNLTMVGGKIDCRIRQRVGTWYGFSAIFRTSFAARRPCTSRRGSRDSHSIRFAYTSSLFVARGASHEPITRHLPTRRLSTSNRSIRISSAIFVLVRFAMLRKWIPRIVLWSSSGWNVSKIRISFIQKIQRR